VAEPFAPMDAGALEVHVDRLHVEVRGRLAERPDPEGEFTAVIMQMPAWDETVGAWCDDIDAKPGKWGERRWYSARELEAVALYQRVAGLTSCRAARDRLASDRGVKAREALEFNEPRERRHRKRSLLDGVPPLVGLDDASSWFGHASSIPSGQRRNDSYHPHGQAPV
jgi:hypothetical protein